MNENEHVTRSSGSRVQIIFTAADELRLLRTLAAAADALLDVTVAATPDKRVSSVATEIGALHRAWKAWHALVATGEREGGGDN